MPSTSPNPVWDVLHIPKDGEQVKNPIPATTPINTGCCISQKDGNVKTTMPSKGCCSSTNCGGDNKIDQTCGKCTGASSCPKRTDLGKTVYCTAKYPKGHAKAGKTIGTCTCISVNSTPGTGGKWAASDGYVLK